MKNKVLLSPAIIVSLLVCKFFASSAIGAGLVSFMNSSSTLISTGESVMPNQASQTFYFAVFVAPASTVLTGGEHRSLIDPSFQFAAAYNTNHPTVAGRLGLLPQVDVGAATGFDAGQPVDFVIRGWSSNLGETWTEARDNWFGTTLKTEDGLLPWMGSSSVGNDLYLGGGVYPTASLMGFADYSVPGFALQTIPEPSVIALVGGGLALGRWKRRHHR